MLEIHSPFRRLVQPPSTRKRTTPATRRIILVVVVALGRAEAQLAFLRAALERDGAENHEELQLHHRTQLNRRVPVPTNESATRPEQASDESRQSENKHEVAGEPRHASPCEDGGDSSPEEDGWREKRCHVLRQAELVRHVGAAAASKDLRERRAKPRLANCEREADGGDDSLHDGEPALLMQAHQLENPE